MKNRARMIIIILLAIVLLAVVLIFRFATTSTIVVSISPTVSPISTIVTIDGKTAMPRGSGGQEYVAIVGPGSHEVEVSSPGYTSQKTDISTRLRSSKKVEITLRSITAEDVAQSITKGSEGLEVRNPKLFGNNDWIVFVVGASSGPSDGLLVVARFDTEKDAWEVVFEGTGGDVAVLTENNAPSELINYLRNGNR